jgi:hypothetical protein
MVINVRMLAYHDPYTVRPVYIPSYNHPTTEHLLSDVFKYGQNDFICGPDSHKIRTTICSVSSGDVIELPTGECYRVEAVGFKLLTKSEYKKYMVSAA